MAAKNVLTTVFKKVPANKVFNAIGKFYMKHDTQILTTTQIAASVTAQWFVYKNAQQIHECIKNAKYCYANIPEDLTEEELKAQKDKIMLDCLKELGILVAPIIIFNGISIGSAVAQNKASAKKIATLTAALSMSQNALQEYESFRKEAVEQLGEEKVKEIDKTVGAKEMEVKEIPANLTKRPEEDYIYNRYTGHYFVSTEERIKYAVEHLNHQLDTNGGVYDDVVNLTDFFRDCGDKAGGDFMDVMGYVAGDNVSYDLSPNRMPEDKGGHAALCLTLWPNPKAIDREYVYPGTTY